MNDELRQAAERLRENVYHVAGEQRLDDLEAVADFALPLLDGTELTLDVAEEMLADTAATISVRGGYMGICIDSWIPVSEVGKLRLLAAGLGITPTTTSQACEGDEG